MKTFALSLAAVATLAVAPAYAHHSFAMFDGGKLVVLKGTMVSFSYLNPHAWISLLGTPEGKAKSKPVAWDIEATAPVMLAQMGLTKDTLKAGDKITVGMRPLRDGRNGGSMVFVIGPDGKTYGAKPSDVGYAAQ